ncbi:MAG: TonB-dependent siderophore receptor [Gluconacetobacter sp.]
MIRTRVARRLVLMAGVMSSVMGMRAAAAQTIAEQGVRFDIPAGDLDHALTRAADQSGMHIFFPSAAVAGKRTAGLSGVSTVSQALARLLAGSGLSWRLRDGRTIIVAPDDKGAAIMLGPVRVQGKAPVQAGLYPYDRADAPAAQGLERRVIGGTKVPTALGENPQSISSVDRTQMDLQAAQSVPEALRYMPGVTAEVGGDDNRIETGQIFVRGFNPNEYLDGLRLQAGTWATPQFDAYALQSLDVIKGPDSVVYGLASPGGLVTLTSKTPTDTPLHEVRLTGGSWGRFQAGVDVGDRLNASGSVAYRVVGLFRNTGTQVDHTTLRRFLIAPSIRWRIDPATSVTFLASYQADPEGGFYNQLPYKGTLLRNPYGRIATSTYLGEPGFDRLRRNQFSVGYAFEHQFLSWLKFRQNFRYQFLDANYNGVTSDALAPNLQDVTRDGYMARETLNTIALDNQLQADYRTGPVRHVTLAGIDYQHATLAQQDWYGYLKAAELNIFHPVYSGFSGTVPAIANAHTTNDQVGFYVQQEMKWENLSVIGGVRGDLFDEQTRNRLKSTTTRQSQGAVTGRIGAIYRLPFGISPYANYSTSFMPQVATTFTGAPLAPTRGQQVEVGIKYQPRKIDGFLTLALYDLKEQNVVTADPVHTNFAIAAGAVRSRGAEVEAHYAIGRSLRVVASYGYVDQKITRKINGYRGGALPGIPRQTASAWADYTVRQGGLEGFGFGGGLRYQGISFANYANQYHVPGVLLFDMDLHYDLGARIPSLHGLSAQFNISNIGDRKYIASCVNLGCYYGLRRNFMGSLQYRW